ncbi:26S proteasome regulatory complex, subunit RPN3/PSMD3 [Ceraceosorus bombacis]|uniref:26S proteasome regulatory complex, subunit RPN3/PSMD3 n=1 Tax=Ceraceosorus bombacis TaxID=401625 RepID=A0A0P1BMF6_9BASI|nr:26S proteasome regulatory complex, subunit RPN3/PSMD3 [Ceraceosorus bombacis]
MASQATSDSKPSGNATESRSTASLIPTLSSEEQFLHLLRHNLTLITRGVTHLEPRFTARALRSLTSTRRKAAAHPDVLATIIEEGDADESSRAAMLKFLPKSYVPQPVKLPTATSANAASDAMDVDESAPATEGTKKESKDGKSDDKDSEKEKEKEKEAQKEKERAAFIEKFNQPFKARPEAAAEVQAYLRLLLVVYLLDGGKVEEGQTLARSSIDAVVAQNKRSQDLLSARLIFYLSRSIELLSKDKSAEGLAGERPYLLSLYRTSSLRHDPETQATLINLLLRSYIEGKANLYDQADKLVARAPFPRSKAGNGQVARYEYYVGRIRAVQLNYSEAHTHLQQAIRRAPAAVQPAGANKGAADKEKADGPLAAKFGKPSVPAAGFLQTAHKFLVVVELLMGDIPERSIFRAEVLKKALAPYMEIVQAVRVGDLSLFQKTLSTHEALFQADRTRSLIVRLRHNVIKTGIRTISLAYSRISLADITRKLHLESEEDAEYIVAKAVRDGVIEARVDHERGEMKSADMGEIYKTNEPQTQFRQRIDFCLQLHNESVKAMRYPLNNHKAELDSAVAARERERELANEIADGDISEDDEDWV